MITEKEIKKQITFFYYEKIDQATLDDLMKFIHSVPQVANPRYNNGTNILLDNIKIDLNLGKMSTILIGINMGGSVTYVRLEPKKYHYFNHTHLVTVDNPEDVILIY